jgi:hypothetical protein
MKHALTLNDGWTLSRWPTGTGKAVADTVAPPTPEDVEAILQGQDIFPTHTPRSVHEVLLDHGVIDDPAKTLSAESIKWVAESDWIYVRKFDRPEGVGRRHYLHFKGLDTLAVVYLNGQPVARHEDLYLPLRVEVSAALRPGSNVLAVHFISPHRALATMELPQKWTGHFPKNRMLRKPHEDFNAFNGMTPYLTTMGVFGDVLIESDDGVAIDQLDIRTWLSDGYRDAQVELGWTTDGTTSEFDEVQARLISPSGQEVAAATAPSGSSDRMTLRLDAPELWFPRGYGSQPLYELCFELRRRGELLDRWVRRIGFRDLRCHGSFDFSVNGQRVKLWGANLTPLQRLSHRWEPEKFTQLMDLVEHCNMVTLRAWGPGAPWNEHLYDEADRRGLLVWHEFFHTWGMYPDHDDYRRLCRLEAEHEVRTLKHHPSLLMWCGGNECHMGSERDHPGRTMAGRVLYEFDYPAICARLDPDRMYLVNSPFGGAFANDPTEGDSHSYTHQWFVPGHEFPIAFTENTRFSTPLLKSMKRYLADRLWPAEFRGTQQRSEDALLPEAWQKLCQVPQAQLTARLGAVEELYDTGDSPEGLIYRLGTGHAQWIRRSVERYRRGRPSTDPDGPRRVMAHYLWKLNATWPSIYSNVIDDQNEPNIAYYALRRAYAPVLLSFDIGDRIHLWIVNDSGTPCDGSVHVALVDPFTGKVSGELSQDIAIAAGRSRPVMNLDPMGMFDRQLVLSARFIDRSGRLLAAATDFAQIERRLRFPDPRLVLRWEGPTVEVTTDTFARSVELEGDAAGDEFGWHFEDNFFDLLPGETRTIRLLGRHRTGTIRAKSFFGSQAAEICR